MTISYNWLKTYLPISLQPERVAELLTDIGLEVEAIEQVETIKGGLKGVVVGEVMSCNRHPNADRLSVTTVNIGVPDLLQIVCGAPNVAVGQKVPVATVGTTLYSNGEELIIKKGKIRGEASEGMICAEDELGLGTNHDGIMVLDDDARIGMPASEYFKIETDYVFEIGLTPNRTDAMSHYGVARDLRAALIQQGIVAELTLPAINFSVDDTSCTIPVIIENAEACPQYLGVTVSNVKVQPSPDWLQKRLKAIGLKPINNIVDITNFVLHETGHPLHAFDAAAIKGNQVVVRGAGTQKSFVTLDETERVMNEDDLMICNAEEGMCIAGVFGGFSSGVNLNTNVVFIESAIFNPVYIRKTAKRHGLNTDASYRYERGVDPGMSLYALKRAAVLMKELAGGKISSDVQIAVGREIKPHQILLRHEKLNLLVGNEIGRDKIEEILVSLEFKIVQNNPEGWLLEVPTYRVDVTREADVVEEFLRIYGFNRIELPGSMKMNLPESGQHNPEGFKKAVSALLVANGLFEVMNNSLTRLAYYETLDPNSVPELVHMLNPLSQDLGVLRHNLIFGGLEVIARNQNRQRSGTPVFEFGKVYSKHGEKRYHEEEQLMIMLSGVTMVENWQTKTQKADFYAVKGLVEAAFERFGLNNLSQDVAKHPLYSECLFYKKGEKILAQLFQIPARLTGYFGVDQEVYAAVIHWEQIVRAAARVKVKFEELPRFPWVRRDLALLVDLDMSYETLRSTAQKAGGKLVKSINLFDVYTGKNLPEGKKSYAMSFILQDLNQTLVDKKVDQTMEAIKDALLKQHGAQLR